MVCLDCKKCGGNAPPEFPTDEIEKVFSEVEISELVEEISEIVDWENAGFKTDWTCYGFEYQKLVVIWRKAERRLKEIREARFQNFIKSFSKE